MAYPLKYNSELIKRFHLWLVSQKYHHHTVKEYAYSAEVFAVFLRNKPFTKVTYVDVLEFLASKSEEGKSIYSLHHYLHALRVFYDFLDFGGLIKEHAPRRVRMKALPYKIPVVLNEGQVSRLIAAARTPRERVVAELLYATGCRAGELAKMKVEDIDFEEHKIRVIGKRSKPRFVLFGSRAEGAIRAYLKGRNTGYLVQDGDRRQTGSLSKTRGGWTLSWKVYSGPQKQKEYRHFVSARRCPSREEADILLNEIARNAALPRPWMNEHKSVGCINNIVKRMAVQAGMPHVCAKMLRHTFATHMLNHNAPLPVIQQLMGHTNIKTTEIYTHVSRTEIRKTYDRCHPSGSGE
ncbi:MAG: tyrosine-type recombinase/integrase [Candidatus Acidiferrales bacterium]